MSIFGKIKDAIFGRHAQAAEPAATGGVNTSSGPATVPGTTPAAQAPSPGGAPSGASPEPQQSVTPATPAPGAPTPAPAPAPTPAAPSAAPVPSGPVDVAAIMDRAVKDSGQTLDWRRSVVDLMKALHLDSSLAERKELADELGYTGDKNDSATMNVWLHKALMKKLGENGGKVPADLTD